MNTAAQRSLVAGCIALLLTACGGSSPAPDPGPAPAPAENRFGLMLGAAGLTLAQRVALVQQLGAVYFRPNSLTVEGWNGTCLECDAATQAGLRLVLTVRNNGGGGQPSTPPQDAAALTAYAQTLGAMLDAHRPELLVVENEENSSLFFDGTPAQYGTELSAACNTAHARQIRCTNGGPVSLLVALLVYNDYVEAGNTAQADSFAQRAFTAQERSMLGSPQAQEQIQKGKALLQVYRTAGIDYLNFHWYVADPTAFGEAAAFLARSTGLPVITNEIGQHDTSGTTVTGLMAKAVELQLRYAVWFSIDSANAYALIEPNGTLRSNGIAFQQFVQSHFPG